MLVPEFLTKIETVTMAQSSYSPDFAAAYILFFPKLIAPMKGNRFASIDDMKKRKKKIKTGTINDTKKRISEVFRGLNKRWH